MKKQIILIALLLLFIVTNTAAQDFLNTPLVVSGDNLTQEKLERLIKQNKKITKPKEINKLKTQVKEYNDNISKNVGQLLTERQNLNDIRQRLLKQQNVIKLDAQIIEARKSYKQIEEDILKNLKEITYKSIFVYVEKNADPFEDPDIYIQKATKSISPIAIESVRGSFITSITELYKKEGFDDKLFTNIKETISGQLKVDNKYDHKMIDDLFWYACKVDIGPLKSPVKTQVTTNYGENKNVIIIDGLKDTDIKEKLTSKGVSNSIADNINGIIIRNKQSVINENRSIKLREINIITSGQEKLNNLENTIKRLTTELNTAHKILKSLINNNTSVSFAKRDIENSIKKANAELLKKINKNISEELNWKEKIIRTEWERTKV